MHANTKRMKLQILDNYIVAMLLKNEITNLECLACT